MRITQYLSSLRFRIGLVITSLALISGIIYSVFAWFIFEISDDRLFNWHALSINKAAVEQQKIPENNFNSFSVVGNEQELVEQLVVKFSLLTDAQPLETISSLFDISNTADYPGGHKMFDIEYSGSEIELQIVATPWQKETLYMVYDVSGFETATQPTNIFSDNFVLIVLIPLAIAIAIIAAFLSIGLTQTILQPLTNLASQVSSANPEKLDAPLTEHFYPDEVGELANTFNGFLTRIENYVENEKRFSREVSHELRTPTTSLSMALELMAPTELNEKQQQLLARMQRANNDMTQLISTFIWLAKNAPEDAPVEKINLYQHVEQVIEKLNYLSEKKTISILNQVDRQQEILINRTLVDIVLNNLIRNALQYTHQGKVEIKSGDGTLVISDTGIGIPSKEIENIEQVFYSLQPDGIGLGMSIVNRIITRLGWKLVIESQEGKGTQITVLFS